MTSEKWQIFSKPIDDIADMMRIVQIVKERQRQLSPDRGVIPKMVQPWMRRYRAEQTLRKDMALLWQAGYLERIGGGGSRRGYRVSGHI
jgi:hypothetical protein